MSFEDYPAVGSESVVIFQHLRVFLDKFGKEGYYSKQTAQLLMTSSSSIFYATLKKVSVTEGVLTLILCINY